jgi:hypothetical protein
MSLQEKAGCGTGFAISRWRRSKTIVCKTDFGFARRGQIL